MKKTNKKIVRKFAVALAAVMAMTTAGAIGASADNSALNTVPKVKGWYTSIYNTDEFKELVRNDRLWHLQKCKHKDMGRRQQESSRSEQLLSPQRMETVRTK